MNRTILSILFSCLFAFTFSAGTVFAQFNVTGQSPAAYSTTSSPDGTITITFSQNVNASSLSNGIFISGSVSGSIAGTFSVGPANRAVFTPSNEFSDGEKISVTVTSNVRATNGASIATPVQWSFYVQPFVGSYEFSSPQIYNLRAGSEPSAIKAVDLTNNLLPDLVVVNSNNSLITILENRTQTSDDFSIVSEIETGIGSQNQMIDDEMAQATANLPINSSIATADLNRNGNTDIIVAATLTNQLIILRNNQADASNLSLDFINTGERPVEVISGDFNKNGAMDLAVASAGTDRIFVHYNNGNGSFSSPQSFNVGLAPTSISAEDINGNGFLDIIVMASGENRIEALINNGAGSFSRSTLINNLNFTPSFLVTGNFLQNTGATNYPDIILGSTDDTGVYLFENNGSSFSPSTSWSQGNLSRVLASTPADLNSNGFLDLINSHFSSGTLMINQLPSPGFTTIDTFSTPLGSTAADLNLGGSMDIAVTSSTASQVRVYFNLFDASVCEEIFGSLSIPTQINFGSTEINSTVTRQFQIINNSNVSVDISMEISNGEFFELETQSDYQLASGGLRSNTISFTPTVTGEFADELLVRVNTVCGLLTFRVELIGEVGDPLPDLVAVDISSTSFETEYFLGVDYNFEGLLRLDGEVSVTDPFNVTFLVNNVVQSETRVNQTIQPGQTLAYQFDHAFQQTGQNTITFIVDTDDEIEESNTANNRVSLSLTVLEGQMVVSPNPFTPNDDGFNDQVRFDFSQLANITSPRIQIFSFNGRLVRTLNEEDFNGSIIPWNGRDNNGDALLPGVYLYVVQNNNQMIVRGAVTLAL